MNIAISSLERLIFKFVQFYSLHIVTRRKNIIKKSPQTFYLVLVNLK